ncbi:hypothetical protein ABIA32_005726 [Streptacidiphilus sp. MAP12-20]
MHTHSSALRLPTHRVVLLATSAHSVADILCRR